MRVSLKAIAERVGVTEAAVSMALRNTGTISAKRRKQIIDMARELNYVPNFVARGLSTGKSQLIGFVTATSYVEVSAHLMDRFELQIRDHHYQMIGSFHQGLQDLEKKNIQDLIGRRADGVVGFPVSKTHCASWRILKEAKIPFVIFNESAPFPHNHVNVDIEDGARQMVDHLIHKGRRRLAFLCTGADSLSVQARLCGWRKACQAHRLDFDRFPLFATTQIGSKELIHRLITEFLRCKKRIDGVVAANDMLALAVLQALHRKGVSVPKEVAVIGFDDSYIASLLPIPLTSIRQPIEEAAYYASHILQQQIANPTTDYQHVLLKPQLIERETTAVI